MPLGGLHMFQGNFRLNHEAAPFNDPAVRQGLIGIGLATLQVEAGDKNAAFRIPPHIELGAFDVELLEAQIPRQQRLG